MGCSYAFPSFSSCYDIFLDSLSEEFVQSKKHTALFPLPFLLHKNQIIDVSNWASIVFYVKKLQGMQGKFRRSYNAYK